MRVYLEYFVSLVVCACALGSLFLAGMATDNYFENEKHPFCTEQSREVKLLPAAILRPDSNKISPILHENNTWSCPADSMAECQAINGSLPVCWCEYVKPKATSEKVSLNPAPILHGQPTWSCPTRNLAECEKEIRKWRLVQNPDR